MSLLRLRPGRVLSLLQSIFADGHGFARGLEAQRAISQIGHIQGESNLWLIPWTNG
jgi:hypothetical protein